MTKKKTSKDAKGDASIVSRHGLLERMVDGVSIVSVDGSLIWANGALARMCGYESGEDLIGMSVADITSKQQVGAVLKHLQKGIDKGLADNFEFQTKNKNGTTIPCLMNAAVLHDIDDNLIGNIIVIRDVTDIKAVQDALRKSESRHRMLIEMMREGVVMFDEHSQLTYANDSIARMTGYKIDELLGLRPQDLYDDVENEILGNYTDRVLSANVRAFECVMIRKDGSRIDVIVSPKGIIDEDGVFQGSFAIVSDITDRKQLERERLRLIAERATAVTERKKANELEGAYNELRSMQSALVQTEKMVALGQLASGIAHEVKNPLGIIMQGIGFIESGIDPDDAQTKEAIRAITDAVFRADKIVRDLLGFARRGPTDFALCHLGEVMDRVLTLIRRQLTLSKIAISLKVEENLPPIWADRNQIEQVFLNILINSFNAMPDGGKLRIKIYTDKLAELREGVGRRLSDNFKIGEKAIICDIKDTGVGIPEDKIGSVFDPFFTTRQVGEGTGLGLAISKSIIDLHGGIISLESKEGRGTKVIITLPISKKGDKHGKKNPDDR